MSAIDSPSLALVTGLLARVTLVLAVAWLGAKFAARWPASTRHALWLAAFVAVLALPVATRLFPAWRLPVLPAAERAAQISSVPPPTAAGSVAHARPPINHRVSAPPATRLGQIESSSGDGGLLERARAISPFAWGLTLWAAIAVLLMVRYVAGLLTVRRIIGHARPMDAPRWLDALDVACATLEVVRPPQLIVSDAVSMPFTCGFVRATLVVPESALGWTDDRIDVVLRHELAHVARRDCVVQALAHAACALYWFHPLAWIGARHLRAERERACDDLVLATGTQGTTYAEHLLDIARAAALDDSPLAAAALAMARPSELEGRLLAILDPRRDRGRVGRRRIVEVALTSAALVVPLASVSLVARSQSPIADPQTPEAEIVQQAVERGVESSVQQSVQKSVQQSVQKSVEIVASRGAAHAVTSTLRNGEAGNQSSVSFDMPQQLAAIVSQAAVGGVPGGVSGGVVGGVSGGVGHGSGRGFAHRHEDQDEEEPSKPVSPAVIQALTEALKDSDADVRKSAMQALARFHSPAAYDAFVAGLKDADPEVRQQAAFALSQLRDSRATDPLMGALKDSDAEVRQQAAFALSQLRDSRAVPALTAALKDPNDEVREQALFALSQIRDASAVPALVSALSDPKANVRQQAAFALSQIEDEKAVPALVGALKDKDEEVREQAAFALSQMGDESAIEPLTALLKDPSAEVRQQAVFALSQLAGGERHHRGHGPRPALAGGDSVAPVPTPPPPAVVAPPAPAPPPTPRPH